MFFPMEYDILWYSDTHLLIDNRTSTGSGSDNLPGDLIRPGDRIEFI